MHRQKSITRVESARRIRRPIEFPCDIQVKDVYGTLAPTHIGYAAMVMISMSGFERRRQSQRGARAPQEIMRARFLVTSFYVI